MYEAKRKSPWHLAGVEKYTGSANNDTDHGSVCNVLRSLDCYIMLCYVMLCYVMLCYVMLGSFLLYYILLCCVVLYYIALYYSILYYNHYITL